MSYIQIIYDKDRQIEALEKQLADQTKASGDRMQELLQTIVRLTNETPFSDEVKGWQEQRAKLTAEVGSLRAALMDVRHQLLSWQTPGGPKTMHRLLVANILAGIEQALEYKP